MDELLRRLAAHTNVCLILCATSGYCVCHEIGGRIFNTYVCCVFSSELMLILPIQEICRKSIFIIGILKTMKIVRMGTCAAALAVAVGVFAGAVVPARAATGVLNVEATVLNTLRVTCGTALDFGSVAAGVGGQVAVGPSGTRTSAASNLLLASGPATAGVCAVHGTPGHDVSISATDTVLRGPSSELEVTNLNFETIVQEGPPYVVQVKVGGTLNVERGDGPGIYTGAVTITADYQ